MSSLPLLVDEGYSQKIVANFLETELLSFEK
jgi:hypothetical protein